MIKGEQTVMMLGKCPIYHKIEHNFTTENQLITHARRVYTHVHFYIYNTLLFSLHFYLTSSTNTQSTKTIGMYQIEVKEKQGTY